MAAHKPATAEAATPVKKAPTGKKAGSSKKDAPVAASTYPLPASDSLKAEVQALIGPKGRLYARIPHPDFADVPAGHRPHERQEIIEPHLTTQGGTAIDIGCYLGAFSHWLEDLGYDVTAIERQPAQVSVITQVRDLCGKKFDVLETEFYDLEEPNFDLVLALNVFHHSLKRERVFNKLVKFLRRLECKEMIFEPHDPAERQFADAYRNMDPDQFVAFVSEESRLPVVEHIGIAGRRNIYRLSKS